MSTKKLNSISELICNFNLTYILKKIANRLIFFTFVVRILKDFMHHTHAVKIILKVGIKQIQIKFHFLEYFIFYRLKKQK